MLEIQRILVPTDFSRCAQAAMEFGCQLALKFDAELILLHVQKDSVPYHGYDIECPAEVQSQLDQLPGDPWTAQLRVNRRFRVGPPAAEIVAEATDKEVQLIVIGTQGTGPVKKLFVGSVAEKVIHSAPCPVVTMRAGEHPDDHASSERI